MQSLKKKASKFFKISSNHAQTQEQGQPSRPSHAKAQEEVHPSKTYANIESVEAFDPITAADEENANVASNIQLNSYNLTKKPSRFLLRKASSIFAPTTADPLPPPPLPVAQPTTSPTVIQTNVAAKRISSSPGKQTLRSKASRFFRSNTASSATSQTNKPLPALPSPSVVVSGFKAPSGSPPPRPNRPETLDPELMEMMRNSVYRLSLLSGSVSSGSRRSAGTSLPSAPLSLTSSFPEFAPPMPITTVRDSAGTVLAAQMSDGGEVLMEIVRKDGVEYYPVRRSSSGTPGTLWRDDKGFLHFVPDV